MKTERLAERLKIREFKLNALLEMTTAINNNFTTDQLIKRFREIVETQLGITKLVLFGKREDKWECMICCGVSEDYSAVAVEDVFSPFQEMEIIQTHPEYPFRGFSILIPIFHNKQPLAYLLVGDLDEEEIRISPTIKHMRFIQTLSSIFTVAIENKSLEKKNIERERMNRELELAAEMQSLLVSIGFSKEDFYEVASHYKPHQAVGGDFYDCIRLNEQEVLFCVADVSGKGISAAFLMANFQAYLRAILTYTTWTLESVVTELNKKVIETVNGDRFVTFFIGHFNKKTGKLRYINAGHHPAILEHQGHITLLSTGTVGIGMLPELPFIEVGEEPIHPGSRVLCYTDGVVEVENDLNEEYGTDGIVKVMMHSAGRNSEELIFDILADMEQFRAKPYFDDTALLCCRFF